MKTCELYREATREGWRFPSMRGQLTVEDLWKMKLASRDGFDLDNVAIALNRELKSYEEESFVKPRTKETSSIRKRLELVKDIIETKLNEAKKAEERLAKEERRKKLLEIIAKKQDSELEEKSLEDLKAELAELE